MRRRRSGRHRPPRTRRRQRSGEGAFGLAREDFLRNLESPSKVEVALTRRLRRGEPIPGFGHAMYPDGHSRASLILEMVRSLDADKKRVPTVDEVIRTQARRGLPPPNAGFPIPALAYVCDMVPGAGEVIFTMSSAIGWIAHVTGRSSAWTCARVRMAPAGRRDAQRFKPGGPDDLQHHGWTRVSATKARLSLPPTTTKPAPASSLSSFVSDRLAARMARKPWPSTSNEMSHQSVKTSTALSTRSCS